MKNKTPHKYAQLLRWIADGETLQLEMHGTFEDVSPSAVPGVLCAIANDMCQEPERWRIKPATMQLYGQEVEAPLTNPHHGQPVWHCNAIGEVRSDTFNADVPVLVTQRDLLHLYASKAAALKVWQLQQDHLKGAVDAG